MEDGKFTVSDLDAKEHIIALVTLLVSKNLITEKEYEKYRNAVLEIKNEQLEKELQEKPYMKLFFDMLSS